MPRRSLRVANRERPVVREYEYTPLEDANECIRLLMFLPRPEGARFRAEMWQGKLCDAPRYDALSYTWGQASDAFVEIEICQTTGLNLVGKVPGAFGIISQSNGEEYETYFLRQRFPVTLGLEAAMRGLHPTIGSSPIWIDAICIDQKNDVEKGHQVLFMDRMYRRAHVVLIWLGEEAEESGLALNLLREYEAICGCPADKAKDLSMLTKQFAKRTEKWTSHWQALGKLIKRPWFSRRWIIQEIVFAQKKLICCGTGGTCWDSLTRVACIYHNYNCRGERNGLQEDWALIRNLDSASMKVNNGEEHHLTLAALLAKFYKSRCTNPKDAIYSLVSMARDIDPEDWLPDYSANNDDLMVFRKAFEHLVHTTQSLDVMCRTTKLPAESVTWLPKFGQVYGCDCGSTSCSKFGYRDGSLTTFSYPSSLCSAVYNASGSTRPRIRFGTDGRLLFADGYLVDSIKKIPPDAGHSHCRSCNRMTVDLRSWLGVAFDIHQGKFGIPDILAGFLRSVVGNRTLKRSPHLKKTIEGLVEGLPPLKMLSEAWFRILFETDCFTDSCGCDVFDLKKMKHSVELLLMQKAVNIVISERTFAVTECSMGFVPLMAQEGDIVGILLGCSVPVIRRPCTTGSGFTFVGECYIHGLMEGEYMEIVSKRGPESHEIEIH